MEICQQINNFFFLVSVSQVTSFALSRQWSLTVSRLQFCKLTEIHWNISRWIRRITKRNTRHWNMYTTLMPPSKRLESSTFMKYMSVCLPVWVWVCFFFLIKSQEQQSGMDFLNYQVSHLLLSKAKYHVIPYLIKPLKPLWFFHNYFALPNMKIHCRSQVSKTIDFIPKKT